MHIGRIHNENKIAASQAGREEEEEEQDVDTAINQDYAKSYYTTSIHRSQIGPRSAQRTESHRDTLAQKLRYERPGARGGLAENVCVCVLRMEGEA